MVKRVAFGPRLERGAVYVECPADTVPASRGQHIRIRWDRPARRQGETVGVDFGGPHTAPYPHREGAPWKRVTDYAVPEGDPTRETFYRLQVTVRADATPVPAPAEESAQGPGGAADDMGQEATTP